MKKTVILFLILLLALPGFAQKQIRVACVGNSITYGAALPDRETQAYPGQLQQLLGSNYEVKNFGHSGTTLLSKGHRPYIQQQVYKDAIAFAADIVVIHLGINDTDPRNWPNYQDFFVKDYLNLIDSFRAANPNCRVIIARLTPIAHRHARFESGTRDWRGQIQLAIENVARIAGVQLMDFEAPLYPYPFMFPDGVHPSPEGAKILAETVYSAISGDFGGLRMPITYTDHMVLQRNRPLTIHGMADAGKMVTVNIARQKQTVKVASDGRWQAKLLPLAAGGPYVLSVTDGTSKLVYKDVMAGEVWLCSGQSNMEFMLKQSRTGKVDMPQATNDQIRLFDMKARWRTDAVEWESTVLDSLNHLQYYTDARWELASSQSAGNFSAVAYYFGKMLQDSLKVPVGLICNAIGGSPTEAWIDRSTLEYDFPAILRNWTKNDFIQDWVRGRAALNVKKSSDAQQRHPYEPCYLYEAGIRSLEQYPLKGVIWYQGESNAHNIEAHEKLFSLLVKSWRKNWNNENLPFYYVQLSSIDRPSWPWFRDSQRRFLETIPHTGMAVSSDQGDSLDVHPTNKKPVGERLSRWALNDTYGYKNVVPSGPLFQNAEFRDGAVFVTFSCGEGMHSADGKPLCTFEVAEVDGLYEPAIAEVENNCVKVYSGKIKNPRFVRYGWQPFTRANLVNGAGLPASTFRAVAPADFVTVRQIQPIPGFPKGDKDFARGVSACFAGTVDGQLLLAGGCNFPKTPAKDGGTKKYYQDIYVAETSIDSVLSWKKIGKLPQPVAYGVSVSTSDGVICAGGMNEQGALTSVYRIRIENKKAEIETLPSLPCALDNMTGAILGNILYIAGGNKNGKASNAFYCLNTERLSEGWKELPAFPGSPRVQPVSAVQLDADGQPCFYLWGGFAAPAEGRPASLSVDGCVYSPVSGEWATLAAPVNDSGDAVSLGGGTAVAWGDSLILCMGGVHKDIFLQALQAPAPDYLSHPVEWYRFNKYILAYNTRQQQWQTIACTPYTARAGAAAVVWNGDVFSINGELKPGIRTPEITRIEIE